MKGNILVVGGYGGIGRFISTALGELLPGQVIVREGAFKRHKTSH